MISKSAGQKWTPQNKSVNGGHEKDLKVQSLSGASTKRTKPKYLFMTAEGMELRSQKPSVTVAGKKFQVNTATPGSKGCFFSETKKGSEMSDVVEVLLFSTDSSPKKEQKTIATSSTPRPQSVSKKTPSSAI